MTYVQSTLERVLVQPRNLSLWLLLLAATARIELWRREEVRLRELEKSGFADENENEEWDTPVPAESDLDEVGEYRGS